MLEWLKRWIREVAGSDYLQIELKSLRHRQELMAHLLSERMFTMADVDLAEEQTLIIVASNLGGGTVNITGAHFENIESLERTIREINYVYRRDRSVVDLPDETRDAWNKSPR